MEETAVVQIAKDVDKHFFKNLERDLK